MKETVRKKRTVSSAHASAGKSHYAQSKLEKANELLSRVNPADLNAIASKPAHS
jgi:hypothetical protein